MLVSINRDLLWGPHYRSRDRIFSGPALDLCNHNLHVNKTTQQEKNNFKGSYIHGYKKLFFFKLRMYNNVHESTSRTSSNRLTDFLRIQIVLHQSFNNARKLLLHQVNTEDIKVEVWWKEGPQGETNLEIYG